jgi:hypothetical protein
VNENSKSAESAAPSSATIQHTNIATRRSYDALVSAFEHELGYLDPTTTEHLLERKATWTEVDRAIDRMAGPRGLMIIFRADQGKITSLSGQEKRCSLYLVGNPVTVCMTMRVPTARSSPTIGHPPFLAAKRICPFATQTALYRPNML